MSRNTSLRGGSGAPPAVVVDTSVFADYFLYNPRRPERHWRARRVLNALSDLGAVVYEPFILEVELLAVLVRRLPPPQARRLVDTVMDYVNLAGEGELHDEAVEVAASTGCRAADAYYIATAALLDAVLVTSDHVQAANAGRAGVEAYYLLSDEGYQGLLRRLGLGGLGEEEGEQHQQREGEPPGDE